MLRNRSVPDIQSKRKNWQQRIPENGAKHLVFLDESGINTDMTRRYARAKKNQRAADSTPLNTPATTTILSSIRLDGSCIYTTYQGGTTAERFESYLKSDLFPTLSSDDIVVMDNMRSHHAKVVKNFLDEKHIPTRLFKQAVSLSKQARANVRQLRFRNVQEFGELVAVGGGLVEQDEEFTVRQHQPRRIGAQEFL